MDAKAESLNAGAAMRRSLGRLKIFLGIGPGAGKTAAMNEAAAAQQRAGRHVVVLERQEHEEGVDQREDKGTFDAFASWETTVGAVIARRPDIALVEDLGGRNAAGSRHDRRYKDALALLDAGIDAYGTLNVHEIASRAEALWPITGLASRDAVPDSILDSAEIALVDIAPAELRRRLERGQFRPPKTLAPGASAFYDENCLLELREMAARLFAEKIARDAQQARRAGAPAPAAHRLLAAIEFGWEAEPLILLTRRLAGSLNAPWIVLGVETSRAPAAAPPSHSARMMELARELGAEVITIADDNFAEAVLRVAKARNITQIVVGKTAAQWWRRLFAPKPAYALLAEDSGGIDVHVASMIRPTRRGHGLGFGVGQGKLWPWLAAPAATAGVMAGGFLLERFVPATAASLLSLLAIVGVAAILERGPALLATTLIAAGWDYFFMPPYFHFSIVRPEDKILMAMYFTVALILGQFTTRLRAAEAAERQREERATALYLLTRELAEASTTAGIVEKVAREAARYFEAEAAILLPDGANRLQLQPASKLAFEEKDLAAAAWVLENRQWAGKFTGNLPMLDTMFLPLESSQRLVGVMGLRMKRSSPPTIHDRNLLEAIARQAAVALDRQHLRELSEKAEVVAASERLGKTLLDSMSHEIRTPLAAIQAAAGDLEEVGEISPAGQPALGEIREAAGRLNRLVGNVLDITRLESGHVKPLINECDLAEIVHLAVTETTRQMSRHSLKVSVAPGLPIIRTDFVFLQQALMNLLANAAIHTPPATAVELRAWQGEGTLFLAVADRGPGIDPQRLDRVFDKFYRGPKAPTGGIGLGLSLVKGFVRAVGGDVAAANRAGGGAEFTIRLPLSEAAPVGSVGI